MVFDICDGRFCILQDPDIGVDRLGVTDAGDPRQQPSSSGLGLAVFVRSLNPKQPPGFSTRKNSPAAVLLAMNFDRLRARGLVRVTLGRFNTPDKADRFVEYLARSASQLKARVVVLKGLSAVSQSSGTESTIAEG
jgi:hypothetical protein